MGAPGSNVLLSGEPLNLSQAPGDGWLFDCWMVNGAPVRTTTLSSQPSGDTAVEAVFIPDFAGKRAAAFSGKPESLSHSWNDDPDGDGLNTWQEILLGADPTVRQNLEGDIKKTASGLRVVFSRPQGSVNEPWITPQFSDGLSGWDRPDGRKMTERVLSVRDGIETVEITLPFASGTNGFFRLKMRESPIE